MAKGSVSEFSYIVDLSDLCGKHQSVIYDFKADFPQRAALAARFGIVELCMLQICATLTPQRRQGHYRITGELQAKIVQNCVVSLEPILSNINATLNLVVYPDGNEQIINLSLEDEESETYWGSSVDLGEIASVELALAIDPYPRSSGDCSLTLGPGIDHWGDHEMKESRPFAALEELKGKS